MNETNVKTKQRERQKMFRDVYDNTIPERFPVHDCITLDLAIEYSGKDKIPFVYDYTAEGIEEVLEKSMEISYGDTIKAANRNPAGLLFKQSKVNVMNSKGFVQHPETSGFEAEEYDEFIQNPYDFTLEKVLPRLNPGFDTNSINRSVNFTKYVLAQRSFAAELDTAVDKVVERHGLFKAPKGSSGVQLAPFDFLADFCRGFAKVPLDIRRVPEKVEAACEALVPYLIEKSKYPVKSIEGENKIMTHMATFLRPKDFERFYWPTFYKMVHMIAERGQACYIFCESDWTRYIDYLQELPQGTRLHMEYGDPKKFKDKLGKKMILSGFYPINLLKTGTKQQCIDKAKELVDILAPGGNFEWRFDKSALELADVNLENYHALMQWIVENNRYDNAGEKVSPTRKEDTIEKFSDQYPEFKSKYIISYEEWKQDYPPVNEKADEAMRKAYERYSKMVEPYNDLYCISG
ncbi:MAG TPA: hypothetical protein DHN33_11890 [Eubacteriaceae bacterium]|nr:hypothetical protein [Eubacteriaceae bacterium]